MDYKAGNKPAFSLATTLVWCGDASTTTQEWKCMDNAHVMTVSIGLTECCMQIVRMYLFTLQERENFKGVI